MAIFLKLLSETNLGF